MNNEHRYSHRPKQRSTQRRSKAGKHQVAVESRKRVRSSRWGNWYATVTAIAVLLGAAGLIVGGANLGVQLIVNPDAVGWVNSFSPEETRIPTAIATRPQTLAQINDGVRKKGLIPGETLLLSSEANTADLFLPVLERRSNCQTNCEQIVELRVYQREESSGEARYRLFSQVAIAFSPEESSIIAALDKVKSNERGTERSLPLTQVSRFNGKVPETGVWLNLTGKLKGEAPIAYGQVFRYNPETSHLGLMLSWTSPAGNTPYWQEVTGSDTLEFVVDRTVDLEPQFRVYKIEPRNFLPNPIQLEEISLTEPVVNSQAYRNALIMAKSGLWSRALALLQSTSAKEQSAEGFQAQMDLIRLHAQVTKEQLNKPGASPAEQVLVNLIDGRWQDALLVFQSSEGTQSYEIATLLKTDPGRFWKRVEAAIKVNPADSNVQAWGALILAAQQGRPEAIAWLQQLNAPATDEAIESRRSGAVPASKKENRGELKSTPDSVSVASFSRINELLDQLDEAFASSTPITSHFSQVIGSGLSVSQLNPADWLQPDASAPGLSPALLSKQQTWHQVQVSTFYDGDRWRRQPFSDINLLTVGQAKRLWKLLGLNTDPQIQITFWNPNGQKQTKTATVKAAQIRNGVLQLLAASEVLPGATPPTLKSAQSGAKLGGQSLQGTASTKLSGASFLAHTEKALRWLEPNSITLADLNQVQPQWVTVILPTLWLELQRARLVPSGPIPSLREMLQSIGNWSVQPIDLTGNNLPDAVLTLYSEGALPLKKPLFKDSQRFRRRTIIFSENGAIIYSEFTTSPGQSLGAIADLGDGNPAALVLESANNYTLKRWSNERQRFE